MSDYYTVIVISTINSLYGQFPPQKRFEQTMECIDSIERNIPNAQIVFVDNSNAPIQREWREAIEKRVTVFHEVFHNLFSLRANMNVSLKSESEANMLWEALEVLKAHNLYGKRIFKISGRYKISDTFDIATYENPGMIGKMTFVPTQIASTEDNWFSNKKIMWFQQALISFEREHIDLIQKQLFGMLAHMQRTGDCIEETMFYYIPHEKVFPLEVAHIEGIKAEGGEVKH